MLGLWYIPLTHPNHQDIKSVKNISGICRLYQFNSLAYYIIAIFPYIDAGVLRCSGRPCIFYHYSNRRSRKLWNDFWYSVLISKHTPYVHTFLSNMIPTVYRCLSYLVSPFTFDQTFLGIYLTTSAFYFQLNGFPRASV